MANDIFIKPAPTLADFGPEPEEKYCFACEESGHESDENDDCLKEYEEPDAMTISKETGL